MNILFLRGFNNYFNRVIKKYSTLDDYQSNSTAHVNFESINFNPNDGVATELVLGNESQKENNLPLDWENIGTPDYCVCYEMAGSTPVIISRWYVLESERLRTGQYRLALKRDVVAEHFDQIKYASCFIEKGMVTDPTNPLIYNRESMTYNQIKTDEYLLSDESKVPWIVGYIAKNAADTVNPASSYSVALNTSGQASGIKNLASGLEVAKIQLRTSSSSVIWPAEPYDSYSNEYSFQANYNSATGELTYRIKLGNNWASYTMYIDVFTATGLNIEAVISNNANDYINSSDLPWTFDPTATNYATINTIVTHQTVINNISSQTYYRYLWLDTTWRVNGNTLTLAGNLFTLGEKKSWPSYDIRNVYPGYTSAVSGNGDFNIYGNETKFKNYMRFSIAPSTAISDLYSTHSVTATTETIPSNINSYNGKIIKHGSKYYRLTVGSVSSQSYRISKADGASFNSWVSQTTSGASTYNTQVASDSLKLQMNAHTPTLGATVEYDVKVQQVDLLATEIYLDGIATAYIPSDAARIHTKDAGYDIFAIPYGKIQIKKSSGTFTAFNADKDVSMAIAMEITKDIGTSKVYDLQLLPYCPVRYMLDDDSIDLSYGVSNEDYSLITETVSGSVVNKSIILFANSSQGSFDIPFELSVPTTTSSAIMNKKIDNETRVYRIVSPNYSGQFEFSLAKNNGLAYFNVDYTYKPYNPYIHINPDFKGLYGQDFNDARGLILGGDFSLPIISDAWTDYQISNKNYQEIFDRQIQNMDVNNQIASEKANWQTMTGAITGGFGGAAGGALTGFKAGGPWGAVAGAALGATGGTILSAIGGGKDEEWLFRQQQESKSYAIDMFGYQLGNIQALPYSLTKTSAITNNNKLVPILEIYNATEVERNALIEKLHKDGMTIMVIGNINSYYDRTEDLSFVKGQMIKIDDINDDFHIADAIYNELQKGVYLTPGLEG